MATQAFLAIGTAPERPYHDSMKPRMSVGRSDAVTALELMVMIAVVGALLAVFVPAMLQRGDRSRAIACIGNLKFVAMAQTMWAYEPGEPFRFAFEVPERERGLKELAGEPRDLVSYYKALSNELGSSRVLACPADRQALAATNFAMLTASGVSYFMNLNPSPAEWQTALHGDAKLDFGQGEARRITGLYLFTNGSPMAWKGPLHGTARKESGNMAFVDGSVGRLSNGDLPAAFFPAAGSNIVVRLLFP